QAAAAAHQQWPPALAEKHPRRRPDDVRCRNNAGQADDPGHRVADGISERYLQVAEIGHTERAGQPGGAQGGWHPLTPGEGTRRIDWYAEKAVNDHRAHVPSRLRGREAWPPRPRPPAVGELQAAWPAVSFTAVLCENC